MSALHQDYPNLEIILVDDGSRDDTVAIARKVLSDRPTARIVVNEKNLGLVGNWNRCLQLAQGEYVKFVFQDDLLTPDCISKMVAEARSGRLIACHRHIEAEDSASPQLRAFFKEHTARMHDLWPKRTELTPGQFALVALQNGIDHNVYGEPTAILLHRSHWETVGMFDPEFKHLCDLEMVFRVAMTFGYIHLAEELCTFRVHGSSTTTENIERNTAQTAVDHVKLVEKIRSNPLFQPFRATRRNRIELDRNALRIQRWFASLDAPTASLTPASQKRIRLLKKRPLAGRLLSLGVRLRSRLAR